MLFLPYKFVLSHTNKTKNKLYDKVKTKIKFTKKELQPLDNKTITCFYTNDEIDKI